MDAHGADPAVLEYDDAIDVDDRRQPVRDQQDRALAGRAGDRVAQCRSIRLSRRVAASTSVIASSVASGAAKSRFSLIVPASAGASCST